MKNKLALFVSLFTLSFLITSFNFEEPQKVTWEMLRDVTFNKKWNKDEAMFILEPAFGEKVNKIKNKQIVITGYMIPVDIDANYKFAENFNFKHQFSLVKGYDRTRDEALINMPPASTKNEISYQHPTFHNLYVALQSEYVFRQNEYPNNNFEVFIPETETMELVDVSTPPDAYHLLNFNSSIDFNISERSIATVGFRVSNLINTSYRNYLNRLRYYADDLGRNFLLNIKINY